jgi:hypothetical protein
MKGTVCHGLGWLQSDWRMPTSEEAIDIVRFFSKNQMTLFLIKSFLHKNVHPTILHYCRVRSTYLNLHEKAAIYVVMESQVNTLG